MAAKIQASGSGVAHRARELYEVAVRLDEAFSEALRQQYGERAGDMRYRDTTWSVAVHVAWQHWAEAMATLRLHWEWSRARTAHEQDRAVRLHHEEIGRILASQAKAGAS